MSDSLYEGSNVHYQSNSALGVLWGAPYLCGNTTLGGMHIHIYIGSSAFIYQGSQSSQHQKNKLLQAIFFAWLAEGRTGPMVIKGVAA